MEFLSWRLEALAPSHETRTQLRSSVLRSVTASFAFVTLLELVFLWTWASRPAEVTALLHRIGPWNVLGFFAGAFAALAAAAFVARTASWALREWIGNAFAGPR